MEMLPSAMNFRAMVSAEGGGGFAGVDLQLGG